MRKRGKPEGIPPNLVPMVSTGKWSATTSRVPAKSATMYAGMRGAKRRVSRTSASAPAASRVVPQGYTGCGLCEYAEAADEVAWDGAGAEAEEVLDLGAGDEDGDAVGEAHDAGARDELDCGAEPGDAQQNEQHAGHEGAEQEAVFAVAGQDAEDDDDKCAGGAADLAARTAQRGDGEAGDDRSVEAGLRRCAGRNGEGHGQGKRDQADGDAGDHVGGEFLRAVITQAEDGLRNPFGEAQTANPRKKRLR